MPQKSKVDALMQQNNCSRTKANNMLRVRANGQKDDSRKTKRVSIAK